MICIPGLDLGRGPLDLLGVVRIPDCDGAGLAPGACSRGSVAPVPQSVVARRVRPSSPQAATRTTKTVTISAIVRARVMAILPFCPASVLLPGWLVVAPLISELLPVRYRLSTVASLEKGFLMHRTRRAVASVLGFLLVAGLPPATALAQPDPLAISTTSISSATGSYPRSKKVTLRFSWMSIHRSVCSGHTPSPVPMASTAAARRWHLRPRDRHVRPRRLQCRRHLARRRGVREALDAVRRRPQPHPGLSCCAGSPICRR